MKAEIITIGDELLIGQVINTNQAYIAEKLNGVGISVERMTTVGDDMKSILDAFTNARSRSDVCIVTGGLGPTHDDVTRDAVCNFFQTDLVLNPDVRKQIEKLLKTRNIAWTSTHEHQTLLPRKASLVPNTLGTAPGMLFDQEGKYFFVLPGVPYEMKEMIDNTVIPYLSKKVKGSTIRHLTLRTSGITESSLAQHLGDIDDILRGARLAFLPSSTGVRMRITVHERTEATAEAKVRQVEQRIRAKVQKYIYGLDEEELEEALGKILKEKNLTIATAESCTGGLIADRITDISGSSTYFLEGHTAYSDASKVRVLGVPEEMIKTHGAVSKEVAEAMASGVRAVSGADIGISTTGIAGPTGGSLTKPIGLVWIGYADKDTTLAMKFNLGDNRRRTKERAAQAALELVRRKLLKIE